jgi:predicted Rossmann-fold nucleotide-binding protein
VVCGGYGGVMEAVCRGASEAGGASLGVVLAGRGGPNAWVREARVASALGERLRILRDSSDAWIFLPRGLGTMLELLWMAESVVKDETPPRPLVLLGDFWRAVVQAALSEASSPSGAEALRGALRFTGSVAEAASAALESARSTEGPA